ncbi:MAG: hypothetical protein ACJ739_11225 [Acidimicrobiales bacterium]
MDAAAIEAGYRGVRERIVAVALEHRATLDTMVPACPEWSGRDLISHVAGVADDLVAGNVHGYASAEWAARHVVSLADASVDEVIERWRIAAARLRDAPPVMGTHALELAFGDAVVHEADLAAAIAPARRVPLPDVAVAIQTGIARWRVVLRTAGAPSLRVEVPGLRTWWIGPAVDDPAALEVDAYELFRLLYGRRSRVQVGGLAWSSDPTPYLDAGLSFPFTWSEQALGD